MARTYRTWSRSRGARLPDESYPCGWPIHVTVCTSGGRRLFEPGILAEEVSRIVLQDPATLAFCLMPDHLHWLLRCARHDRRSVGRMKSLTTRRAWSHGQGGRLWQRSYHDRVLRRSDDVPGIARYLAANPVRAGLVEDADAYPYRAVMLERIGRVG